ncbi:MAG TPA: glycine--tRNA ligase subunit beta [Anaerolineales bacterium]|nr:glycine--tRNA ligase subunit beta [Anaerolineales bacterium]
MTKSSFQDIILKLQEFWAAHGCLIAQPYYTQVGAGTMNPATFLRVLGPEPWNVAYVEPSVRPDDGRYGENPNRFQLHTQYQVILKPDPGNPQELYLDSLKAIGIDPRHHDIRFVEDNWEQPAISAWGLGWEVWLDGQEITQFTYFQQVGGVALDPVAVEITYGLERILIALNNAQAIWDEPWGAGVKYGDIRKTEEYEHSKYYFEIADVARVRQMYDLYRAEAEACLAGGLVLPAHDYVLKCSHAFNTLDTRGAVSTAERQAFFGQMRDLARRVALTYLQQRKELGYPLLKEHKKSEAAAQPLPESPASAAAFVLEIGTEELPASDVDTGIAYLSDSFESAVLKANALKYSSVRFFGTPRRLVVYVEGLEPRGEASEAEVKGPPESAAFDKQGKPTQALMGWAKKNGLPLDPNSLSRERLVQERDGGRYVVAQKRTDGATVTSLLARLLPEFIRGLKFEKTMRWNESGAAFSRPIRWLVCMFADKVIPFEYAGVVSSNVTRGLRPYGSPEIQIKSAEHYLESVREAGILLDLQARRDAIAQEVRAGAAKIGGQAILEEALLAEVTNLVEKPTAVLGNFNTEFLSLPRDVLISTMKKHQRYFPVVALTPTPPKKGGGDSKLLPNFIAIRNGDEQHLDLVQQGNEHVLGARFADADFFVREDLKRPLEAYRPELAGLMFHAKLGTMLDKSDRMLALVEFIANMLELTTEQRASAQRATYLAKADLVTKMVTEMTSLQGIIGREYALRCGEAPAVAQAIGEQYLPVPSSEAGTALALADRLVSLAGLFAAGLAPTGTKDPFGLRRSAIGVVQPLIEHNRRFNLAEAIRRAAELQPIQAGNDVQAQVLDFIAGRLSVALKEQGRKYDVVDAILAAQSDDPAGAARAVTQLQGWVERKDWSAILPAFARCVRITRDQKRIFQVNERLFREKEEEQLYAAVQRAEEAADKSQGKPSVDDVLNAFVPAIPAVNAFFDKVLVMAEEQAVRENRLALLQRIAALPHGVADFSKLEGF